VIADHRMLTTDESVVADAELLGIPASSVTGTRALTGGRGGRTWAIDASGDRYVLHRRAGGGAQMLDHEVLATAAAAAVGVGPDVVALDPDRGLLLTRWIPGRAASAPGVAGPHLRSVLVALRTLHSVDVIEGRPVAHMLPTVDPLATRARYLAARQLNARGRGASSPDARGLRDVDLDEMVAALTALAPSRPSVLIHGDPVPGNLIVAAGTVHLVDFEYAGAGDPWYELGHLAASVHLDPRAIAEVVAVDADSAGGGSAHLGLQESAVEAWSYVAAQAWVAWVGLGEDAGARSPRWRRWAGRAAARLDDAVASRRVERLTAQLRAERSAPQ